MNKIKNKMSHSLEVMRSYIDEYHNDFDDLTKIIEYCKELKHEILKKSCMTELEKILNEYPEIESEIEIASVHISDEDNSNHTTIIRIQGIEIMRQYYDRRLLITYGSCDDALNDYDGDENQLLDESVKCLYKACG